jgi:hypothetical protein
MNRAVSTMKAAKQTQYGIIATTPYMVTERPPNQGMRTRSW